MIKCNCTDTDYQDIRWYSPDEEKISPNGSSDLPYYVPKNGTLIIPTFNDSYKGTYYCGVGDKAMFAANISLTLWTAGKCLGN